jgi:hypothetical protein
MSLGVALDRSTSWILPYMQRARHWSCIKGHTRRANFTIKWLRVQIGHIKESYDLCYKHVTICKLEHIIMILSSFPVKNSCCLEYISHACFVKGGFTFTRIYLLSCCVIFLPVKHLFYREADVRVWTSGPKGNRCDCLRC